MSKKSKRLEGSSQILILRSWDLSLKKEDFVCLVADGNVPHVYEVREFYPRVIMEHELCNNPSLLSRGFKPGDQLPPLLVVRRIRDAPGYTETRAHHTIERKVDADKVVKITLEQIQFVTDNLSSLAALIRERNPNDDSICAG